MTETAVLEMAQNVAAVVGVDDITALIGNNEPHARAMRVLLNRAGRSMSRMQSTWGGGWVALMREHVFETVAGQAEYPFPEDFYEVVDGTIWDRNSYREARGPLTPKEWQTVKSGLIETSTIVPNYRIRNTDGEGKKLVLDPDPTAVERVVIEYVSSHWVISTDGMTGTRIRADTDTTVFEEDLLEMNLLWRFKESRGLSFAPQLAEYETEVLRAFAGDAGSRDIPVGRRRRGGLFSRNQIPETIPIPA